MSASPLVHALPVHPHQLEVQELDSYALIVDLRAAEAYALDHIPRAVSVPWSARSASVHTSMASGSAMSMEHLQGLLYAVAARVASVKPGSAVLIYCDQGGAVSLAVAPHLATLGLTADVLPGGWDSYRRWVDAGIEVLARAIDWRWLRSAPGGVSQALVSALQAHGEQVLDVGEQFESVPVPGLVADPPCIPTLSLASRLVDVLRRYDPALPVWVDEVVSTSGEQILPTALHEALRNAEQRRIDASVECRADLLLATLGASGRTVASLLDSIAPALTGVFAVALRGVCDLQRRTCEREQLIALLRDVLDPLHESVAITAGAHERVVQLPSGTAAAVDRLAVGLIATQIKP